jgi:hypothetical protein
MTDFARLRTRFLRDPLPGRLGALAADLGRLSSTATHPAHNRVVETLLEQARRFVEWTAAETSLSTAAELVDLQLILTAWLHAWPEAQASGPLRAALAAEAGHWSDRVLELSGLLDEDAAAAQPAG